MNYYISDMHLLNKNQTRAGKNYDNRPFADEAEMSAYFLEHWNKKVTNGDTVYIMGDISLKGKSDELVSLVARLNGKKVLVLGNHDSVEDYRYRVLFHEICYMKEITENFAGQAYKLVLCHFPVLMWSGQHRGTILLYGHTHNSIEETFFQQCLAKMNESEELSLRRSGGKKIRAINVGACMPYINYEPRTLQELLAAQGE